MNMEIRMRYTVSFGDGHISNHQMIQEQDKKYVCKIILCRVRLMFIPPRLS